MRLWLMMIVVLLAGCAGQKQITPPAPVERVEPINVTLPQQYRYEPAADYLLPLLINLSQEPFYSLSNPKLLKGRYEYSHEISSTDSRKTVYAFRQIGGPQWGYITTGVGRQAIANIIALENKTLGRAYALVLKQLKICLASQASGVPVWSGSKWGFPQKPGYFECTGLTNQHIYRVGSGLPALLGPYYEETDTMLVFRDLGQAQQILWALKQQFPQLRIPVIDQ